MSTPWADPDQPWLEIICPCTHPVGEHAHFTGHQRSGCRIVGCPCKLIRCGVLYALLEAA